MNYFGTGRLSTVQSVGFSGTAGSVGNVGTETYKVRLVATTDCYVKIDNSAIATAADAYLPALSVEYLTITPGQKVSAIQVASSGTLNVTEIT